MILAYFGGSKSIPTLLFFGITSIGFQMIWSAKTHSNGELAWILRHVCTKGFMAQDVSSVPKKIQKKHEELEKMTITIQGAMFQWDIY